MPDTDCQMPCDADCEIAPVHCWNAHRPNHKPDWHDSEECDKRYAAWQEMVRLGDELQGER